MADVDDGKKDVKASTESTAAPAASATAGELPHTQLNPYGGFQHKEFDVGYGEAPSVSVNPPVASNTTTGWWQPTFDIAGAKVTIAAGSVTAPWDDRSGLVDDAESGIPHKENYHHFLIPQADPLLPLTTNSDNYYFLKAIFDVRFTTIDTLQDGAGEDNLQLLQTSVPVPTGSGGGDSGAGSAHDHSGHYHTVPWLYTVLNFFIEEASDITIVRFDDVDATAEGEANEDIVSGSGATIYQYLGHCNLDGSGNITDQAWRTGHTIDFRLPSYTTLETDAPIDP